jgi:hypothetical protein
LRREHASCSEEDVVVKKTKAKGSSKKTVAAAKKSGPTAKAARPQAKAARPAAKATAKYEQSGAPWWKRVSAPPRKSI